LINGKIGSFLRWLAISVAAATVVFALLANWQWSGSTQYSMRSASLDETRVYRVFNRLSDGPVIYSLDGNYMRNGLFPAVIFSTAAILRGQPLPKIVAVDSTASRDRDFRPLTSSPTYWRPSIAGRANDFDSFLFYELLPRIEGKESNVQRYIMGHSLSGLYVLDLASRKPGRFAGFFAFAPTFSHDVSIRSRLPTSCGANTFLYANWGLESERDTDVFEKTIAEWKAAKRCRRHPPLTSRHYGSLHATIMLTGQLHLAAVMPE
jgi:predicted alpha/beta superfamily hydrolase